MNEKGDLGGREQFPEEKQNNKWMWIIIPLALLFVIILGAVLFYGFGKWGGAFGEGNLEERIEFCVDKYDEDCNDLWGSARVKEKCRNVVVADRCFYRVANYKQDISFCLEINNETLQEQCVSENENLVF